MIKSNSEINDRTTLQNQGDDVRGDIISEQSFLKEQAKSQAQNARRFKAVDAIEDREFEDREPLHTAVGVEDLDSAVSPQADSPGDSEEDAVNEFLLGVNFRPDGEDAFEEPEESEENDEIENFERADRIVYAEQKSSAAGETPSSEVDTPTRLDEKSEAIASERPSPRSDADSMTSTH